MRITGIETYPVWGGERNYLFVVVDTDEGVYGVGEAGLTGRELAVIGAIEYFEPLLLGEDARSAICGHRPSARSGRRGGRPGLLRGLRLRDVLGPLIMKPF